MTRRIERGRRLGARWLTLPFLVALAAFLAGGGAAAQPTCDKFASVAGLDTNPGTQQLPFRTAQRLVSSLAPGEAGCLRGGTYAGRVAIGRGGTSGAPITLQSYPGERGVVIGRLSILPGSNFVTVSNLDLVGLDTVNAASPMIEGSDVTIEDNDITNGHTADCVFVGSPDHRAERVAIRGNRIHDCGRLPFTNRHQGITVWNSVDSEITGNVIYDNADRGVQLYPNAQRTHVAYNTIDGNGEGVLISGGDLSASSGNIVERNVITNSVLRDNVEAYWADGAPVGTGNVVRENCVSGGSRDNGDGGIQPRMDGVLVSGNLVADPGFVDRLAKNFALEPGSPCLAPLSGKLWRPFRDDSPFNVPAAQKGTPTPGNPFAGEFTSYSSRLEISGIPGGGGTGIEYAKPIFYAKPGDPVAGVDVGQPSWVKGDIRWDGKPIPVPAGVKPAPGSDGHLTIVSADRRTAWDMWRCTKADASGYVTEVIAQWDLTGSGVPGERNDNSSARGSGMPIIPTTIRAEEALYGINHALGITVPSVSSDYIYPPASHSDGNDAPGAIKYGMLFVLRPDFPVPAGASIGERNVIQALKTYGAYVTDQGASMELDADSTQPDVWAQSGLQSDSLNIGAEDFRLIQP